MKHLLIYIFKSLLPAIFSLPAFSQQLSVQVNYSKAVKVYHDEPLLLTVSVVNKEAQENQRWNNAGNRRLNELEELMKTNKISKEEYDTEKQQINSSKKTVQPLTFGSNDRPWYSLVRWKLLYENKGREENIVARVMPIPSSKPVALLDEKGFYKAWFGIDAAEIKKLPAGKYKLVAVLEGKNSGSVQIELQEANMPGTVSDSEEMILRMGKYHWHADEATTGMAYADRLLKKNPNSMDGYSLRADLFVSQKKYKEALSDYQAALKLFYKEYPGVSEPPEYLLEMIAWVKTEMEK